MSADCRTDLPAFTRRAAIRVARAVQHAPLVVTLAFMAHTPPVPAAVFDVNATIDAVDAVPGDGVCASAAAGCTLRAAIQEANALPGSDLIHLPAERFRVLIPGVGEDAGATGDLDITDDVSVIGAGSGLTIVDGKRRDRVFDIAGAGSPTVSISGVTIKGGKPPDGSNGGGVRNAGALALQDVVFRGNSTRGMFNYGAGLFAASGVVQLTDVSFIGNIAAEIGHGGGLAAFADATLELVNVTFAANRAAVGAGISNAGTIEMTNVTLFNNRARAYGGGIHNRGAATLTNVTLANNHGAALTSCCDSQTFIKNTIVQGRPGGPTCSITPFGMISLGYNTDSDTTCPFTAVGDQSGVDARLDRRPRENGGITRTIALLPGSPAIDSADSGDCPPTDQRGVTRPQGNGCDRGAYEVIP
jgi:CSLREA domain-containing protein